MYSLNEPSSPSIQDEPMGLKFKVQIETISACVFPCICHIDTLIFSIQQKVTHPMTQEQLPIIVIAALVIGLAKGGLGGTLAGLVTPITSIFMPVQVAVGLLLPLLMMGDWLSLYAYWKEWDTDVLKRTLPLGIVGNRVGYVFANQFT